MPQKDENIKSTNEDAFENQLSRSNFWFIFYTIEIRFKKYFSVYLSIN